MPVHIALFRGINVGRRNKLPMADLKAVLAGSGVRDARTYIQSGTASRARGWRLAPRRPWA